MLTVLKSRTAIAKAQRQFETAIRRDRSFKPFDTSVGHIGGNFPERVYWSDRYTFWHAYHVIESSRHWNAFGIEKPENDSRSLNIACEINFPLEGPDWRIAGAFCRNDQGKLFLAHSGKIGGGRKGVGKNLFMDKYQGSEPVDAWDGNKNVGLFAVADLGSSRFLKQLSVFVHEVDRIKKIGVHGVEGVKETFSPEFSGKAPMKGSAATEVSFDHGIVVNTLADLLTGRKHSVSNYRFCDLRITKGSAVRFQFEVKTANDSQSIYSAIGQLLFHTARLTPNPLLVFVSPTSIGNGEKSILRKLGIEHLGYEWNDQEPVFQNLDDLGL